MRHELAETYFNEPVDAEALGIPEYHNVITVLQTKKLNQGSVADRAL